MKLYTDKEWMILDLNNLNEIGRIIDSCDSHSFCFDQITILIVELIAMTVTL